MAFLTYLNPEPGLSLKSVKYYTNIKGFTRGLLWSAALLFAGIYDSWGQQQEVADSLRLIYLADTLSGVEKLDLLGELAFNESNDPELALAYANELILLASEQGNQQFLYTGYMQRGNSQVNQGNLDLVLEAFKLAEESAKKIGSKTRQSTAIMSMGFTYAESGDHKKAEEHFDRSLAVIRTAEEQHEPAGKAVLGEVLFNSGDYYLRQGAYEKARKFLEEAGQIFKDLDHRIGFAYYLGDMGALFYRTGDPKQARVFLLEAIQMLEQDQDYAAISEFQAILAEIYMEEKNLEQAHKLARNSLEHAIRLNLKDQISQTSRLLSDLDQRSGNYKEAIEHLLLHMKYQDSMDVETVDMTRMEREMAELENVKLENELELQTLRQKRQEAALWAIGVTALLLVVLVVGAMRRYRYVKNTNAIISEERDRSEKLLLNILPKETAQELKNNGRVLAKRFESVSVLFTDFKGFTSHAESLDPEKLVESIDYYFSHFDGIVEKYGLEKIKTVGDAYMCAGGLPFPSSDHAHRVAQVALELIEFVEGSKKEVSEGLIRFDIRVGINSGPVVAGVVGTKKFAYDIWGDTVNIASRMESTSEVGKINIAEETYQLIKDDYECEYRGKIDAKNRGKLKMYFLLGKKARSKTA